MLVGMSGTYWYEQERLARAFLVDASVQADMKSHLTRFDGLGRWIASALGPPTTPVEMPPAWIGARPLPDAAQLALVRAGARASR